MWASKPGPSLTRWTESGMAEAVSTQALVMIPALALEAVSEGFCPACTGPLTTSHWCPLCKTYWFIGTRKDDSSDHSCL